MEPLTVPPNSNEDGSQMEIWQILSCQPWHVVTYSLTQLSSLRSGEVVAL